MCTNQDALQGACTKMIPNPPQGRLESPLSIDAYKPALFESRKNFANSV
jgi:hypothetical protein